MKNMLCNMQCHVVLQQLVELAACRRGHLRNCEKFTKVRPCSSIYNSSWVGVVFNQGCCLPRRCSRSSPCPANITPTLINLCTECARLLQEARGHTAAMLLYLLTFHIKRSHNLKKKLMFKSIQKNPEYLKHFTWCLKHFESGLENTIMWPPVKLVSLKNGSWTAAPPAG